MFNLIEFIKFPLVAILLHSALIIQSAPQREPQIRVAILENAKSLEIAGEHLVVEAGGRKREIGNRAEIEIRGAGLRINGKKYATPAIVHSGRDFLYVNDKQYRGEIVLHLERDGIIVIDVLPVEAYLVGLINAEMNSKWPLEAVKAQAVVARTFALKKSEERRSKPFDLRADVSDQVYNGSGGEDEESVIAVKATRGEVLTWKGGLIQAYYHSTCGGRTASSAEVWGTPHPYLEGVECSYCSDSPRFFWKLAISGEDLGKALQGRNIRVETVKSVNVLERTPSGRAARVEIIGDHAARRIVEASLLRAAVGYVKIFSTRFEVTENEPGRFLFMGQGSGHGVGMCQWGARGMALANKTYREILATYYPGAELSGNYHK